MPPPRALCIHLKCYGYKHTAVLDEGILVWAQMGYPVQYGKVESKKK